MLDVEGVVVIVAVALTYEFEILLGYDKRSCLLGSLLDTLLLHEYLGVLACLVEIAETAHHHVVHTLSIVDGDVKVAHHKRGEVVACQLEKQLILLERVGGVGKDEDEVSIALRAEVA